MDMPGRVYRLGILATCRGPVDALMICGLKQADAEVVVQSVGRLGTSMPPIAIVPGTHPPREIWRGPEPTVIPLADVIGWDESRDALDCAALRSLVQSISTPPAETAWLTVTEAATLVMEDFPHLGLDSARVRVSRAASVGQVTTNGQTGRERRVGRQSLDAWRLAERDRNLAREERY